MGQSDPEEGLQQRAGEVWRLRRRNLPTSPAHATSQIRPPS